MAQKVEVLLVDDLDGGQADETISFSLDGTQYEIDLSEKNASQLRDRCAPFTSAARRTGGRRAGRGAGRPGRPSSGPSSHEVRAWAKAQGIDINERGRIPADVLIKYQHAQGT